MIQLFLQPSKITPEAWERAYGYICEVCAAFPAPLVRIEAYNGYSPEIDKEHSELCVDRGTPNERIRFYGDSMSFTAAFTVEFWRDWGRQLPAMKGGEEVDPLKPITWHPDWDFKDDGSLPLANGVGFGNGYIETEGAFYVYALIAIGIMLENVLPGAAFLTAREQKAEDVAEVVKWLEGHFQRDLEGPIYFDKERIWQEIAKHYDKREYAVGRMEKLYRKQFKRNMTFAIAHAGEAPAREFYARALATTWFGTFGFADIWDAWVAATADLESALPLVTRSREMLLEQATPGSLKEAEKYDLSALMKGLLNNYILWTPQQRELLRLLPTNEQELETGESDLWGIMRRMTGMRVNISPIYATAEEVFEAFMYHDPQNGITYRKLLDDWIAANADAFEKRYQQLKEIAAQQHGGPASIAEEQVELEAKITAYVSSFPAHEQFLVGSAIMFNPAYLDFEERLKNWRQSLNALVKDDESRSQVERMYTDPKSQQVKWIRSRLKERRLSVHPDFEAWIEAEEDRSVLFHLVLVMTLKPKNRVQLYLLHRVLMDRGLWDAWRVGGEYGFGG